MTSVLDQMPLSRKQALSIGGATATAPQINLWHGAVRSGKTIGSLFAFLMAVATAPKQGEIVVIGRTRDTVYRNLMQPLMDGSMFGEICNHITYNRGAPTATICGRTVHILGSSDVRAEGVIRGMTICLAYVDEATLIAEEFFSQLVARMSVTGARLFATTNPDGPQHWLNKNYIKLADKLGHKVFHFTLEDNRQNLPEGYIEGLWEQYTGLWRKRFLEGAWCLADGMCWDAFDPEVHQIKAEQVPNLKRILAVGVDYGTTNPTAGIMLGLGTDHRLYALAEWHPEAGTDAQLSKALQAWLREQRREWGAPEWLFIDPAAASFKLQLFEDRVGRTANAVNDVTDGIRLTGSLFSTHQLYVVDTCTRLLEEIPGYVWDTKASEKGEDKPVKQDDHFCDALRYSVASSRMLWRPYLRDLNETIRQPNHHLETAA